MQSILTFLAVLVLAVVVGEVPFVGRLLNWMLSVSTVVLWLFLMFKAISGERYQLPYIGEIADRQN